MTALRYSIAKPEVPLWVAGLRSRRLKDRFKTATRHSGSPTDVDPIASADTRRGVRRKRVVAASAPKSVVATAYIGASVVGTFMVGVSNIGVWDSPPPRHQSCPPIPAACDVAALRTPPCPDTLRAESVSRCRARRDRPCHLGGWPAGHPPDDRSSRVLAPRRPSATAGSTEWPCACPKYATRARPGREREDGHEARRSGGQYGAVQRLVASRWFQ
jgi:hypothetical protein